MRKTAVTLTVFTLVLGVFGAFLRWLQTINAFDETTGCLIPGSGTTLVFVLYCILAAAAICALTLGWLRRYDCAADAAALHCDSMIPTVLGWIFCALFLVASVVTLFTAHQARYPLMQRLLGAFGILAALSLPIVIGKNRSGSSVGRTAAAVATLFFCFWLVCSYRMNAEDPVVWNFAVEILALACSTVAFYYLAAFHFGAGHGSRALLAVQLAVFFDLATLFDSRGTAALVMLVVTAAVLLTAEYLLLSNLRDRET